MREFSSFGSSRGLHQQGLASDLPNLGHCAPLDRLLRTSRPSPNPRPVYRVLGFRGRIDSSLILGSPPLTATAVSDRPPTDRVPTITPVAGSGEGVAFGYTSVTDPMIDPSR